MLRLVHAGLGALALAITACGADGQPPTPTPSSTITPVPSSTPTPTPTPSSAGTCPTPTDAQGQPLYETARGAFVERQIDQGGGFVVVLTPSGAVANQSCSVTRDVYEAAASVERGRVITLFAYVSSAQSGAHPPFSCLSL